MISSEKAMSRDRSMFVWLIEVGAHDFNGGKSSSSSNRSCLLLKFSSSLAAVTSGLDRRFLTGREESQSSSSKMEVLKSSDDSTGNRVFVLLGFFTSGEEKISMISGMLKYPSLDCGFPFEH